MNNIQEQIDLMRGHVASYTSLSPHRQNCLDLCDTIERLRDVLDRLARLCNEPHYGNSDGNVIAQKALK